MKELFNDDVKLIKKQVTVFIIVCLTGIIFGLVLAISGQ